MLFVFWKNRYLFLNKYHGSPMCFYYASLQCDNQDYKVTQDFILF